jgi:copper chaperone CopZ
VLRVSIHCHGCKKKVRKVLKNIEGVQDVKVDAQQHKVIVTGTVDAQTLIQRLQKSGKQALQWQNLHAAPAKDPEPAPAPAPQYAAPAPPAEDGGKNDAPVDQKPEEPVKEPQAESAEKKPEEEKKVEEAEEKETEPEKKAEKEDVKPSDEAKKDGGDSEAAETKAKVAEPANEAAAKEAANDESEAKEKKQSKPKEVVAAAASVDRSLPRHAPQEYNPYYAPQPVMSYNMAQPRQSVSYYAPQPEQAYSSMQQQQPPAYSSMHPPPQPQQQAYSQQGQPMQQWSPSYLYMPYPHASPESYYQDYYSPPGTHAPLPPPPPPLQDSYRLFDDENPNSCSVM